MPELSPLVTRTAVVNDLDELIRSARAGEAAGIGGLYERYATALYRTAYRLAGSTADAEDVVHDVFVGLPEALRRYEDRGNFAAWLARVTVRRTLMHARSDRRRREVNLDEVVPALAGKHPDDVAEAADLRRAVHVAVLALPDGLREVFALRQLEGYSHEEIGALLGITAGASRVRLARALAALRHALANAR
jgi:RNA polymerase sigma-70 factor (ECF subfamily)